MNKFVRTKRGCYALCSNIFWGDRYVEIDDPSSKEDPSTYANTFVLKDNLEKLPNDLFQTILSFFLHYEKQNHEVQVVLLRNVENVAEWKVVVPKQTVTMASVDADMSTLCDLVTGEIYQDIPENYAYAGTMHLHPGNLGAFWSETDDKSELNNPGMHCTIGHLSDRVAEICASVCIGGKRYVYRPEMLIETNILSTEKDTTLIPVNKTKFAKNAIDLVDIYQYVVPSVNTQSWANIKYGDFNFSPTTKKPKDNPKYKNALKLIDDLELSFVELEAKELADVCDQLNELLFYYGQPFFSNTNLEF